MIRPIPNLCAMAGRMALAPSGRSIVEAELSTEPGAGFEPFAYRPFRPVAVPAGDEPAATLRKVRSGGRSGSEGMGEGDTPASWTMSAVSGAVANPGCVPATAVSTPPVQALLVRIEASVELFTQLSGLTQIQCDLHVAGFPGLAVQLANRDGAISVTLLVADPAKRSALEPYLPDLKEQLYRARLRVEGLQISLSTRSGDGERRRRDGLGEPDGIDSMELDLPGKAGSGLQARSVHASLVPGAVGPPDRRGHSIDS